MEVISPTEPIPVYFGEPIPSILRTGDKYSTFRVHGSETIARIKPGDFLSLRLLNDFEFARVLCSQTKDTIFRNLTEEDWVGHERFDSEEAMLEQYSLWEQKEVTLDTGLKIIRYNYRLFFPEILKRYHPPS